MRNDYMKYHESIAKEFEASRDRVRYFIGNRHHGEDGRYKEILLMNYLRRVLPSNVSIGTGFVKNADEITSQIDLIIYNNNISTLFSEGDFVIVLPESVYAIIEVKSNLTVKVCVDAVRKSHENGEVIGYDIYNGIFSYRSNIDLNGTSSLNERISEQLKLKCGKLNHIAFGPNIFMKSWSNQSCDEKSVNICYSFYELERLAFGYFISNLIEFVNVKANNINISDNLTNFLYPIEEGKETKRLSNLEVKVDVPIS